MATATARKATPAKVITMPDRKRRADREIAAPAPKTLPKKAARAKQNGEARALEQLGVTPEWTQFRELKEVGFGRLVEQRTLLYDEMKFREAKVKALDEQIEAALTLAGAEKVQWEDRPVQVVQSNSGSRVKPELLLEKGVPAQVVADCTVPGKAYSYVLVGKASNKG